MRSDSSAKSGGLTSDDGEVASTSVQRACDDLHGGLCVSATGVLTCKTGFARTVVFFAVIW